MINTFPGTWTTDHRLRGIAYLVGGLWWDNTTGSGSTYYGNFQVLNLGAKVWTQGLPNITAVIKGKKDVYDPRTGLTSWTENPALIIADYLCDMIIGLKVDYDTGIDEVALIAAANACDEQVTLDDGGTEKRYTLNGCFSLDLTPDEIVGKMLGAMHGKLIYDGQRWIIQAGVFQVATGTDLTDDDMRKASELGTLTSSRDSFNGIKGTFTDISTNPSGSKTNYVSADFPAIMSDTFKEQDGDIENVKDIELPYTVSPSMAQRIAKIELLRGRQEVTEVYHGNMSCWRYKAGDTITRTSERYGWAAKLFEVLAVNIIFETDEDGNEVVGIDLHLQETDASIFDWSTDEESPMDPAPNSNLPDIFHVLPPTNLRVTEGLTMARDGTLQAYFTLEWDGSSDSFVRYGGYYRVKYKKQTEDDNYWILLPHCTFLKVTVNNVVAGDYVAEVEAVNWANIASYPASRLLFTIIALSAPPGTPQNFTVAAHDTIAYAHWDLLPDLDVLHGGYYVLKHSSADDGSATWYNSLSMGEDIPGITNQVLVPLQRGTYLLKARDCVGNFSTGTATFIQFQSSVLNFSVVTGGSSIQDPTFAGTKVHCHVDSSILYLDTAQSVGQYHYDAIMDLGTVHKVRVTNIVQAEIVQVGDLIDGRLANCDDWLTWDGETPFGGEGDSWLMVEWTTGDPSGSPTWYGPQRLHSSTFEARAFRFTRELRSYDPAYAVAIIQDAVYAEEVV